MNLHQLPKTTIRKNKRIGRGIGSGKGKTAARGTKGQKARGKIPQGFIGETLPLYKKLPFRRGLGNRKVSIDKVVLDVSKLDVLKAKSVVDLPLLIENKLVNVKQSNRQGVKIVGKGPLKVALTVTLPASKSATAAIIAAGGSVE